MGYYRYRRYPRYVSMAERRAKAAGVREEMQEQGYNMDPVEISGRKISKTFWGQAWCDNLENYSDYENRLPRGRSYVRHGAVVHLEIAPEGGRILAQVMGSDLYEVKITIDPLASKRWETIRKAAAGKITNLLDLLQGKLPEDLLETLVNPNTGLFPSPREIKMSCSCPDYSKLCKHIAAVIYGIGNRLDRDPSLFFTMRSVKVEDLITAVDATASTFAESQDEELAGEDLATLFGVEIETEDEVVKKKKKKKKKKGAVKKAGKKTKKKAAAKKRVVSKKTVVKKAVKKVTKKRKVAVKKKTAAKKAAKKVGKKTKTTAKKVAKKRKAAVKKATAKKVAAKKKR